MRSAADDGIPQANTTGAAASSETVFGQQMMKVEQHRHCDARYADRHAGAGDGIQHPCGDDRNHARHRLDVNKPTGNALLAVLPPDTTPI
jgi:hypothetical protein